MKYPNSLQSFVYTAIAIAICSLLLTAFSLHEVKQLKDVIESLNTDVDGEKFLADNSALVDSRIDNRIDAYIEERKQKKIARKYESYASASKKIQSGKHIYGNENARFTLVEWTDLECAYCKKFHQTPKKVVDASNGLVNWELKHLPLPFHNPVAAIEAHAAECVASISGNQAFWVFIQSVFEETKGNGQGAGDLVSLAQSIGIDEEKFSKCVNNGERRDVVASDIQHSKELGINSTPTTFIVDNRTGQHITIRGMQAPEAIASAIQRMKKEADISLLQNPSTKRGNS
ncbi:MAG: thioredoxin domain-containing protein [Pseudomonadales bacterium]|nr:thioredoxin domain-containing protein [Pseudomonadales bacterium]